MKKSFKTTEGTEKPNGITKKRFHSFLKKLVQNRKDYK